MIVRAVSALDPEQMLGVRARQRRLCLPLSSFFPHHHLHLHFSPISSSSSFFKGQTRLFCCGDPRHVCVVPFSVLCCFQLVGLCERYGWYRGGSTTQSCVAPKTPETAAHSKVASAPVLWDTCGPSKNRGASRILSPWSNDAEGTEATERMDMWKQRVCGPERTNPRRHCQSGECQHCRHQCDVAASRESAKEYGSWSACSCKERDSRQNRDSEAGSLRKGASPRPAREGAGGVGTGGGGCGEEAGRGLGGQRGCRQGGRAHGEPQTERLAELTERIHMDADAHMTEDQWVFWRVARSWWFLVWLAVGSAGRWCAGPAQYGHAWWRDGGAWDGSGESQGCSARFAAGTGRCPSGLGSYGGRAAKHGCGGNGFATCSCVDDACGAEPAAPLANQSGLVTP